MFDIIINRHARQMVEWRDHARKVYGSSYESKVAPFRSMLVHHCRQVQKEPGEAAIALLQFLASRGKKGKHITARIFSSAVDIIEQKLLDADDTSRIITE